MQPTIQPGAVSEQTYYGMSLYAGSAVKMEGSPQQPWLTTFTAIPIETAQKIYSRSAKRATIKKPAEKPDLAALMKQHGVRWGKSDGKRILYFGSDVSDSARAAIMAAIRDGK